MFGPWPTKEWFSKETSNTVLSLSLSLSLPLFFYLQWMKWTCRQGSAKQHYKQDTPPLRELQHSHPPSYSDCWMCLHISRCIPTLLLPMICCNCKCFYKKYVLIWYLFSMFKKPRYHYPSLRSHKPPIDNVYSIPTCKIHQVSWHVVFLCIFFCCVCVGLCDCKWLGIVLCKHHNKVYLVTKVCRYKCFLGPNGSLCWGEICLLFQNTGFEPRLVTKRCKYQCVWRVVCGKTLPHQEPFCFSKGHKWNACCSCRI